MNKRPLPGLHRYILGSTVCWDECKLWDMVGEALRQFLGRSEALRSKHVFAGFDGFIDKIVHPVDHRWGPGKSFRAIPTIREFGERIVAAAGKSTNIEWYPVMEKIGGNGPIFANALYTAGVQVRYVGALGLPVHPLFQGFCEKTNAVSLGEPGVSHAAEFQDGKIILGSMAHLADITYECLIQKVGQLALQSCLREADMAAFLNWTMLPHMTPLLEKLLGELKKLPGSREQKFFFDLADPEKRSREDLVKVLEVLTCYQTVGPVYLGLNLKEAQQVYGLWHNPIPSSNRTGYERMAALIREKLDIHCVVIHPCECAVCAFPQEVAYAEGPYTSNPLITTGAGDHFNAGFVLGLLLGASPALCLQLAVMCSGYYVRHASSPTLEDLTAMDSCN